MIHSFSSIVAMHTNVDCAILLHSLNFWCRKNKANKENYQEGRYWTYNSIKAWSEFVPYLTDYKIRTALKILEDENMIFVSEFNKNKYDRTKWYAVNYDHPLLSEITDYQITNLDLLKTKNGDIKNHNTIPVHITDNITDVGKSNQKTFQEMKTDGEFDFPNAFEMLKTQSPMLYEQGFAMKFRSDLGTLTQEEQQRLIDSFNDRVIIEGLELEPKKLLARLRSYTRSWLANLSKEKQNKKDKGRL